LKLLLAIVASHIALDLQLGKNGAAGGTESRAIVKSIHFKICKSGKSKPK